MLKKINYLNNNGSFNVNEIKSKMASGSKTQTEIDNVIRKCAVQKNTPEQTAWEFYKCAYNESQGQNSRRN